MTSAGSHSESKRFSDFCFRPDPRRGVLRLIRLGDALGVEGAQVLYKDKGEVPVLEKTAQLHGIGEWNSPLAEEQRGFGGILSPRFFSEEAVVEANVVLSMPRLEYHSNMNPAASIRSSTKSAAENVFSASRDVVGTAEHVYNKSADVVGIGGRIVGLRKKIDEGTPRSAGFVTFDKLSTVSAACQMIHMSHPSGMRVEGTPPPEALVWDNLGMADSVLQARRLISLAATATVCLFWTIPVSFLVSLTQPVALAQYFPKAKSAFLAHPGLASFLNQLGPLLLQLMNNVVLPELMKFFAKYEGGIGESRVLASMATKMAAFKIVQVFFVSSIADGLIQGLSQFKTVGDVFRYLAATLPPQSEFFIQIILIDSVLVLGLELVRTTALIKAGLRKCIGPSSNSKIHDVEALDLHHYLLVDGNEGISEGCLQ